MILNTDSQVFPHDSQPARDSGEKKTSSLLFFGKAVKGILLSLWGRQMVGTSNANVVVAQSN